MDNHHSIHLAHCGDGVSMLTMCGAGGKNVISHAFATALRDCALALRGDANVRCVLLRAEGPMFCAGGDVKEMMAHIESLPEHIDNVITTAHDALGALYSLPMPLIGCLQGVAAGAGLSLALACDFLVAARSARMVIAYPQLGTTPDCGLSYALSARLGAPRAFQLYLAKDSIEMAEAHALGLVSELVEDEDALPAAQRLASRMASLPSYAVAEAKQLFLGSRMAVVEAHLHAEREAFLRCASTPEFRARVAVFSAPRLRRRPFLSPLP